ncbi:manganese efflux pump [Pedobacter cryoconitis]|uniref:Putative Mn2+ efflux pump MntP n=1 Tax=Pedobacter cryoconitis TaxID=188932 RepID=A0A7X0J740_9SPHI|nr:manganese efflux pump [Pedobacter cryoconitis]MBB6501072.1 putative Mn2+ efflux pump MntP [Pedobacter cryoconitis]
MSFLLLKSGIIQYAILFITVGITADNLMIAKLSGKRVSVISRGNWILILLLLFITQNQMLLWGRWITRWTPSLTVNQKDWLALGLLISIGVKMYTDHFQNKKEIPVINYTANNLLLLAFSSAVYLFVFGMAVQWLDRPDTNVTIILPVSILLFLGMGVWLGRSHSHKLINTLRTICTGLLMLGVVVLIFQLI